MLEPHQGGVGSAFCLACWSAHWRARQAHWGYENGSDTFGYFLFVPGSGSCGLSVGERLTMIEAEVESQSSPEAGVADAVVEVKAVPIEIF